MPLLERLAQESPQDLTIARQLCEAHTRAGTGPQLLARLAARKDAHAAYMRGLLLFASAASAGAPALEAFREAVRLAPAEAEFHYRLGVALLESEADQPALGELREALRLSPAHPGWNLPLAKALFRTGQGPEGVTALRVVVTSSSSPADIRVAQALIERHADPFAPVPASVRPRLEQVVTWLEGDAVPQQALVQLEELEHDFPDLAIVHTLLGAAWARMDDAGKSVEEFRRAIELAPTDGKNHLYLGELYLGRQRPRQANEHFEKALALNPLLDRAWFHLGDAALEANDLQAARERFGACARIVPEDPSAHGKLALVLQLLEDWPAAERELQGIVDRDPENLEYVLRLGVLHAEHALKAREPSERKRAATDARKWLGQVLDKQPENAIASRAMERLGPP